MIDREEKIISALLEADPLTLPSGHVLGDRTLDDEEQTLERLYTEVLGLLPHAVEPLAPRPEAKAKLLAAIAASAAVREQESPAEAAVQGASITSISAASAEQNRRLEAARFSAPQTRRASRWPLAMAAGVALAMIGLGAMMYLRLQDSEMRVARLQEELVRIAEEQGEWREARNQMASLSERFDIVTSPGVEVCPLRAPKIGGEQGDDASGVIFISGGQWLVKVNGLDPTPDDRAYQLWFDTDVGPVSGGTFAVASNRDPIELAAETMPTGTRAIRVTIEPAGGAPEPTGRTVLFGDQRMTLL